MIFQLAHASRWALLRTIFSGRWWLSWERARKPIVGSLDIPICRHRSSDAEFVRSEVLGATAGWDGRIHRALLQHWRCAICGEPFQVRGVYHPDDRLRNPHLYDADGWPLDEKTYQRLPIWTT